MTTQQQQSAQFTLKIGEQEVHITLPALIEPEDSLDKTYSDTAIPLHLYVIACPSLCGSYAVLTPEGISCPQCGQSEFPYLATCATCGELACRTNDDGDRCYACGNFGGNSDGLITWGNKKTGEYHERNTIAEAMERYYEDHFYDDDALLSDIDTTPMTIPVKCSTCHKVKEHKIIGEDLEDYTRNEDGTYTSIQGECTTCLTGNEDNVGLVTMEMSDEGCK